MDSESSEGTIAEEEMKANSIRQNIYGMNELGSDMIGYD